MRDKNLPPGFVYGETYSGEAVKKCGNQISPGMLYQLDSLDIKLLEDILTYHHRVWGMAFKSKSSMELKPGVGKGYHSDWMQVIRYMGAYKAGNPVAPIVVDVGRICDGNHRLYAQYKLGYYEINAFIMLKY